MNQLKTFLLALVILSWILTSSLNSWGFLNEPDDFKGIKWGANLSTLPDMVQRANEKGVKYCRRKNDKMTIGNINVGSITYLFYKDRFYSVQILFPDANYDKMREKLYKEHGMDTFFDPHSFVGKYTWSGAAVDIELEKRITNIIATPPFSPFSGLLTYLYTPIMTEIQSKQPPDHPSTKEKIVTPKIVAPRIIAQKWAVIIGISRYQFSSQNGLQNLIFADDDAKVFANVLKKFRWNESHIKLLVNEEATQRNIMIALESWLTKAGPNDQIVLFWAGHGFPDPEDPEKVYFACYDTDINIPVTGYRMDRVRSALEERKARNVVVLADTCHAGKLITRGERGLSIVPQIDKMSREKRVPKGWIFMVGADTDRQAIEHTSWTNGAFTHSFIKGLSGEADGYQSMGPKDGTVTMGELRAYMNTAMPDETQKVLGVAKRPVITTSTGDPDIWNLTLQAK